MHPSHDCTSRLYLWSVTFFLSWVSGTILYIREVDFCDKTCKYCFEVFVICLLTAFYQTEISDVFVVIFIILFFCGFWILSHS